MGAHLSAAQANLMAGREAIQQGGGWQDEQAWYDAGTVSYLPNAAKGNLTGPPVSRRQRELHL